MTAEERHQYYLEHKDSFRRAQHNWYEKNKEARREYMRKWKAEHREHLRQYHKMRWIKQKIRLYGDNE